MKASWGEQTDDAVRPQMIGGGTVVLKEGGEMDRDPEAALDKRFDKSAGASDHDLHGIEWTPADAAKSAGFYVGGVAFLLFTLYTIYALAFCFLLTASSDGEQTETRDGGLATSFAGLPPVSAYCTGGPAMFFSFWTIFFGTYGIFGIYMIIGFFIAVPVIGIVLLRQYYTLSHDAVPVSALRMTGGNDE